MDIISKINWVDILVVTIVARTCYVALQDGLSHEIFPLIGTAFTVAIGLQYYHDIASFIKNIINVPVSILDLIAFTVLIIGVGIIFKLARVLVDALMKVTWHPFVEKFGGLICGMARGSVIVSMMLIIMSLAPLPYLQHSIRDRSLTGIFFLNIGPEIHARLAWMMPRINIDTKLSLTGEGLVKAITSDKSIKKK